MPTATSSRASPGAFEPTMRALYRGRPGRPGLVEIPELDALVVEGRSSPSDPAFRDAIQALYSIAYGVKFRAKKAGGPVPPVLPLEAVWWLNPDLPVGEPAAEPMRWQALLLMAPEVTADDVASAAAEARARRPIPTLDVVRLEQRPAERAAQILHFGPYAEEQLTVERLLSFVADERLVVTGPHHEIYLSDPNRTRPERLRTLIRYAVAPA